MGSMMGPFRRALQTNITNPIDVERLNRLVEHAGKTVDAAAKELNEAQVDSAVGRKEYFERLTFGAGAAIAAIVSFLGTHGGKLQPAWIMRCSLISLVISMVAALYRNLRYPNCVLEVRRRIWLEARLDEQQHRKELFKAQPSVDVHTGKAIDGIHGAENARNLIQKPKL